MSRGVVAGSVDVYEDPLDLMDEIDSLKRDRDVTILPIITWTVKFRMWPILLVTA